MPNRIIKESINESYGLSQCSIFAQDLYKRLISYADDYGRFNADTQIMKARLYPREEDVTEEDVFEGLVELSGVNKIAFYKPLVFNHFGKTGIYGAFPNWQDHQRIRDSKSKCPDPDDTSVNDWYLRRFVSLDKRAAVIERDNFKCRICNKYVTTCRDAKRFVKLSTGLYNIDHIVPVLQGGRATMENLRLTCPECNAKRKKKFSYREFLEMTTEDLPPIAATCGDSPLESNPIQSESESIGGSARARTTPAKKYGEYKNVLLTDEELAKLKAEYPDWQARIERLSEYIASKGVKYKSHYATIRSWAKKDAKERKTDGVKGDFDTDEFVEAALRKTMESAKALMSKGE